MAGFPVALLAGCICSV